MNNDQDREEEQLGLDVGDEQSGQTRERLFEDFDDSDEPDDDRDTDHNTMFSDIEDDDVEYDDFEEEEPDYFDDLPEDQVANDDTDTGLSWGDHGDGDTWNNPATNEDTEPAPELARAATPLPPISPAAMEEPEWDEEELIEQPEESTEYYDDEEREISLPLGLILVGVVALVLLGAGGYGVMQQRAEMQEEIRRLQSSLATAASPTDVSATRANNEALVELNADLEAELELLTAENRSLQAIVSGLEKQLAAQQEALVKPAPAPKPAPASAPATTPAPAPAAPEPAPAPAAAASGTWFVNFGSYSQEATARGWAERLKPGAGDVVVTTGEKSGRTFYRVRVINLSSRAQADATARTLEGRYDLPKLWVGQSG